MGAIFVEATAVDPTGLLTSHTLGGFLPGIVPGYRRLADAVHAHGTQLFVQLFHGGREQISAAPRAPAVAPSAVPSPRFKSEPRALTARELRALVDGYATAARHCREGGIDGIEISMAHGYLIAQFFTPRSNRRDDAYDAADGRLRFAEEVLEAVRAAAGPELAVGVRLAADELTPDGLDAAACAEIAGAICATGLVDFASFALGHSAYVPSSSWIAPPPPAAEAAIAEPLRVVRRRRRRAGDRHDARGRRRRRRAAGGGRPRRRGRDDPRADRRSGAGAQGRARRDPRGDRVHRLQPGLHRPLPRRAPDRLRREPVDGARADAAAPRGTRPRPARAGDRRGSRRGRGGAERGRARRRRRARRARGGRRRPAAARRPRARAPRAVAALARQRDPGAGAVQSSSCGSARRSRRTTPTPTSSCSRRARGRTRRSGPRTPTTTAGSCTTASAITPRSTPGPRSPTPPRSTGRCSWPTGAAAGRGSTPRRRSPSRAAR